MIKKVVYSNGVILFYQGKTIVEVREPIDPESMMQVTFRRRADEKYIRQIVNRVGRELLAMRKKTLMLGKPFRFSKDCISMCELQFSELVTNAILRGESKKTNRVTMNILCFPEALLVLGITDSLGPIPQSSWVVDIDDRQEVYKETHGRGLFITTSFGSQVVYNDQPKDPEKELMMLVHPDIPKGEGDAETI